MARLEEFVDGDELLDGFGEGVGVWSGGEQCGWKEVKAEREVGGWEDSESLDEDIGYCFVTGKVGVKLIAVSKQNGGTMSAMQSSSCISEMRIYENSM